ncbi:MAG TPA: nuclear transport factor 2 family protein [Anaerolineae bacterium]
MTKPPPVRTDDIYAIHDLLAQYCWFFDDGDADGYASLWTGEGELTGFGEPVRGMAALTKMLSDTYAGSQGKLRHILANVTQQYGKDENTATAKGYNMVVRWASGGTLMCNVKETFELQRTAEGWRITRVNLDMMQ